MCLFASIVHNSLLRYNLSVLLEQINLPKVLIRIEQEQNLIFVIEKKGFN